MRKVEINSKEKGRFHGWTMTGEAIVELEDGRVHTFGTHIIRFLNPPAEINLLNNTELNKSINLIDKELSRLRTEVYEQKSYADFCTEKYDILEGKMEKLENIVNLLGTLAPNISTTTFTDVPVQPTYTKEEISFAIKNYVDHSLGMKDNPHFRNSIKNGILFRLDLEKESKRR